MDLSAFAEAVGTGDPVTISGLATRGGPVPGVRGVAAPAGVERVDAAEMTVSCGAGTPVDELDAALAAVGQRVALPPGGTVGGALATGRSGLLRLGVGHVRESLLQARVVTAEGCIVKAGGPTVKNVSGFDLARLLVGSWGTFAFLGDVILRTRPRPAVQRWFTASADPFDLRARLFRPAAILWDGEQAWVALEGHPTDVAAQASGAGLVEVEGPPAVPAGGRWSRRPAELRDLPSTLAPGTWLAEVGVGLVHLAGPPPPPPEPAPAVVALHHRLKAAFDPTGRLNPGLDPLTARQPKP